MLAIVGYVFGGVVIVWLGRITTAEAKPYPRVLVSYMTQRRVIGLLGFFLPVLLPAGLLILGEPDWWQSSISAYHCTEVRDVFVGVLFAVAWFLFAYRGHETKDDVAGDAACFFALAVALFSICGTTVSQWLHTISALALFLTLAFFSYFLFTKDDGDPKPMKLRRNKVYRACGRIIIVCIVLSAIYEVFLDDVAALTAIKPVFFLETIALWAFGFSWMIKGQTFLKDPEP